MFPYALLLIAVIGACWLTLHLMAARERQRQLLAKRRWEEYRETLRSEYGIGSPPGSKPRRRSF